jgi:DNA ligase-1
VLLSDLVDTSAAVAATRSRLSKVESLSGLLRRAQSADEAEVVTAFLAGQPRQGRIGTGWRTLSELDTAPAPEPALTVLGVDATFEELATTSGKGSAQRRADLLTGLLNAATGSEQEFLFRLLAGELRQGALEGVMVDAIARAAEVPGETVRRAFMLSGSLPATTVAALDGGTEALQKFGLEIGRPVRPMLASPAESLADALADLGECSVEYKLDGARIQVHKQGEEVHVYTRTLREITGSVPELVELTRSLPCETVVLDGETLALTDDGRPRPFQETISRFSSLLDTDTSTAGKKDAERAARRELLLRPYFFDCLHLDGTDLLDSPLRERIDALTRVAGDYLVPGVRHPDEAAATKVAQDAAAEGHEGVVLKALDSPYAAGRRGKAWQKVKPVHTVDLVVIGAEWGHGRRTGYLSNLHLGARDPDGGEPIMVGKTFKGLTDELLAWQTEEFPKHESRRDNYTVYLHPRLVVEIELDGVQTSTRYPGGIALRFARVLRYRPDKEPNEADTITTLRDLNP